MRLAVVAVFDRSLAAYLKPFTVPSLGVATRSFGDEVNREGSEIGRHPIDYELHHLAYFDEETGFFESLTRPECLVRAANLLAS